MDKEKGTTGKVIKAVAIGALIGSVATMIVGKTGLPEKIKKGAESAGESISSMFKI